MERFKSPNPSLLDSRSLCGVVCGGAGSTPLFGATRTVLVLALGRGGRPTCGPTVPYLLLCVRLGDEEVQDSGEVHGSVSVSRRSGGWATSRPSLDTGLPSVAGWDGREVEVRFPITKTTHHWLTQFDCRVNPKQCPRDTSVRRCWTGAPGSENRGGDPTGRKGPSTDDSETLVSEGALR